MVREQFTNRSSTWCPRCLWVLPIIRAMDREERLGGGNASGTVVKVGRTVRKPWTPTTSRVVEYMAALSSGGVDLPRTHGRDGAGRLILDYVPGVMAIDIAPLPDDIIGRVGALVRSIHDVSATLGVPDDWPDGILPAPHRELICHNDLATWNLVIDGDRLVFIDWDGAAPSSRLWDLAYSAIAFAHLFPGADVEASAQRLTAFLAGYDADTDLRLRLPEALEQRARAMYDLLYDANTATGVEPWATMYAEGHGDHWRNTVRFIAENRQIWADAARS